MQCNDIIQNNRLEHNTKLNTTDDFYLLSFMSLFIIVSSVILNICISPFIRY